MESRWFYNRQILILPIAARGPISSGSSEADMIAAARIPQRKMYVFGFIGD